MKLNCSCECEVEQGYVRMVADALEKSVAGGWLLFRLMAAVC